MMLQRRGRGGGLLHLLKPTESTSHSARAAGGKARESEREGERVQSTRRRERRDRVCACLCVRVDCTTASRSPFLQAAML